MAKRFVEVLQGKSGKEKRFSMNMINIIKIIIKAWTEII
jgi:hypothetical protein